MPTKHDETARKLARKKGTECNKGQGPDIVTPNQVIEVETADTVDDAFRQLQGFRRPVYIAGVNREATEKALEGAQGTTVGVMKPSGRILKRSTRKQR